MFSRRKVAAVAGEFLGTGVLTFTMLDVSRSSIGIPYFYAIAAGLAVALMGLSVAADVHLNPALTIGLWTARRVKTVQAVLYIVAQFAGAIAAYGLYKYFAGAVQHVSSGYEAKTLVAEAVGAFVFALVASYVLYEKVWGVSRAVVVGLAYTLGIMVAMAHSNAIVNPAVAWGFGSWAWGTYALGPVLGAIIGVNLYGLLFSGSGLKLARATASVASKPAAVVASAPAKKPASKAKTTTKKKK